LKLNDSDQTDNDAEGTGKFGKKLRSKSPIHVDSRHVEKDE